MKIAQTLVQVHRKAGQSDRALEVIQEAEAWLGGRPDTVARDDQLVTLLALKAQVSNEAGLADQALATYERALALLNKSGESDHRRAKAIYLGLFLLHKAAGRTERATGVLEELLEVRSQAKDANQEEMAKLHHELSAYYQQMGLAERAIAHSEQALAIYSQKPWAGREREATAHFNLASLLRAQAENQRAARQFEQALVLWEAMGEPARQNVLATRDQLSELYQTLGQTEQAIAQLEQAIQLQQGASERPEELATRYQQVALLYRKNNQPARVREAFARAIELLEGTAGRDSKVLVAPLMGLGSALVQQGASEEAQKVFERALEIRAKTDGQKSEKLVPILNQLAQLQAARGKVEETEALYARILEIRQSALTKDHPLLAGEWVKLGKLLVQMNKLERSIKVLEQAVELCDRQPCEIAVAGDAHFLLAHSLWELERNRKRALKLAEKARDIYTRSPELSKRVQQINDWLDGKKK